MLPPPIGQLNRRPPLSLLSPSYPLHELQAFLSEAQGVLGELQVENTCALITKAEFKATVIPFLRSAAGLSSGALDAVALTLVQFSQTMELPLPLVESALPHMAVIAGRTKGGSGSANAATSLRGRSYTLSLSCAVLSRMPEIRRSARRRQHAVSPSCSLRRWTGEQDAQVACCLPALSRFKSMLGGI